MKKLFSRRIFLPLALRFLRHEAWAITAAIRFPFFSIFIHATLWVWVLPATLLLVSGIFAMEFGGLLGLLFATTLACALLAITFPWFLRWYFVCVGLMFKRPKMAHQKASDIATRLAILEGSTEYGRHSPA